MMKFLSTLSVILLIAISCLFVSKAFQAAEEKDFWLDEHYTLGLEKNEFGPKTSVRNYGYFELLLKGAPWQGSSAPLDYIAIKFLDQIKEPFGSLGLPFNVYYRLNSIFFCFFSGLLVVLFAHCQIRKSAVRPFLFGIQNALLILALSAYYFWPLNFHYAIEMRPYALWNSLWFMVLGFFLIHKEFKKSIFVFLILLAVTATASVFQFFSLAFAFFMMSLYYREDLRKTCRNILKYFTVPFLICFFYIFGEKIDWWYHNFEMYLAEFVYFWTNQERIPLLASFGLLLTITSKKFKSHAIIFLTILFLYLIAPLVNYMTLKAGFFFAARQYLYYYLIYPVFLLSLALNLPEYLREIPQLKKRTAPAVIRAVFAVILIGSLCFSTYEDYGIDKKKKMIQYAPKSYEYLVKIGTGAEDADTKRLEEYVRYYKLVTKYLPYRAESHGMLGFCYYHLGKTNQAIASYKKAIILNPDFFWFHYNIGVIHYKNGEYEQALASFEKAVNIDPEKTLNFIFSSKQIYIPIVNTYTRYYHTAVDEQLHAGYKDCYTLLALSYYHLKSYEDTVKVANRGVGLQFDEEGGLSYLGGRAAYQLKDYIKATYFFLESLKRGPGYAETFQYLGNSLKAMGKEKDAMEAFTRAAFLNNPGVSILLEKDDVSLEVF